MQKTSANINFPSLPRNQQITNAHCGPAVLQMLVGFLGVEVEQDAVVVAANAHHKLNTHGVTVDELGKASKILFPDLQFWYKENSTIDDLDALVNNYKYPVAVEWQGVFLEYSDDDDGHYSIVTYLDKEKNILFLFDPYPPFSKKDRKFLITQFEPRWWEINEIIDPVTHEAHDVRNNHMMFMVTRANENFPEEIGMLKA